MIGVREGGKLFKMVGIVEVVVVVVVRGEGRGVGGKDR